MGCPICWHACPIWVPSRFLSLASGARSFSLLAGEIGRGVSERRGPRAKTLRDRAASYVGLREFWWYPNRNPGKTTVKAMGVDRTTKNSLRTFIIQVGSTSLSMGTFTPTFEQLAVRLETLLTTLLSNKPTVGKQLKGKCLFVL